MSPDPIVVSSLICNFEERSGSFKMEAPTLINGFLVIANPIPSFIHVIDRENWALVTKHVSLILNCVFRNVHIHKVLLGNFFIFREKNGHYKTRYWRRKIKEIYVKFLSIHFQDSKREVLLVLEKRIER